MRACFRAIPIVVLCCLPSLSSAEPVRLPDGSLLGDVDFERHVVSLLGKHGCSAGACHGSFQGKGGLRLSLFGHDPEQDYIALTRGALGRRIDLADPDGSLLLLKASGRVSHGGGKRFGTDSWQYQTVRAWIAAGARYEPGHGTVRSLHIEPSEQVLQRPSDRATVKVIAQFLDGTRTDVTPFCDFRAKDDSIATISGLGEVHALAPGDTPLVASFRGNLATARLLVPFLANPLSPVSVPENNRIDREVFAKLRRLNIIPSEPADDGEFLRRITIDTIGCLPTPQEVRAFLADMRPTKRAQKIDELLAHPLHAALWATKFCDITACDVDVMDGPSELRDRRARMWHDWFRTRVARNVPYHQIVNGILTATSREGKEIEEWIRDEVALDQAARNGLASRYAERPTLDLFWRRVMGEDFFPVEQMAELTAAAFLGVRLECAQCHKHPFDRWTQADYRGYANAFAQVQFGSSPELTAAAADLLSRRRTLPAEKRGPAIPRLREVYITDHRPRYLPSPETTAPLAARALGGPALDGGGDLRAALFRWMVRSDNAYFAPSFVNRVWAHYFGIGLVDPADAFSVANPASNEPLLQWLAGDFIASSFDLRRLERLLLQSRTYQLSSRPNTSNANDRTNYSHARARPMMAEAVLDVLNAALGTMEDFGAEAPPGSHAMELASNRVRAGYVGRVFRVFGRPARRATCDCERPTSPAIPQALFLMSDPDLLEKMAAGRVAKMLARGSTDADAVDELFLASLSRFPDAREKQAALKQIAACVDRRTGLVDVAWALINTREFILNH